MNILIKLTCLIGLVIAPILGGHEAKPVIDQLEGIEIVLDETTPAPEVKQSTKEIRIESVKDADGKVKATVTTVTDSAEAVEVFEGTEAEVAAKIEAYKKK